VPQVTPWAAQVVGVQPQTPGASPPPQVSGATQTVQAAPFIPHAASVGGETHVPLPQQPFGQLAPEQVQEPPTQSSPDWQQAVPQ
jgi:hypothetical protein